MKKFSKILSVALLVALVLSLGITNAFASNFKITITNAVKGETYHAYKIFDVTYSGTNANPENGSAHTAYSYSITKDTGWWSDIIEGTEADSNGNYTAHGLNFIKTTDPNVFIVDATAAFDAARFATFLDGKKSTHTVAAQGSLTGLSSDPANEADRTGELVLDVGDDGYYFVDSAVGSLLTLDTAEPSVQLTDKNTIPDHDKKQQIDEKPETAADYVDTKLDVQVGDTVWYQIEVKDGKGTDNKITITDIMSDGLTFDGASSIEVVASINNAAEAGVATTNYEVTGVSDRGFTLELKASYVATLTEKDKVYIRFSAKVNTSAVTHDIENNTSKMDYSNQHWQDTVEVVPYKFQLDKTDKDYKDLLGAKFELYRGTAIADGKTNLVKFSEGTAEGGIPVLIVDPNGTISEIQLTADGLNSAKVIIKGLDKDDYLLHETAAPAGYNAAADQNVKDTLVVISGTITDVVNTVVGDVGVVTVVNQTGTELPSTGGIGTTIFYVVGGVLVLAAIILLVTKKRMSE